MTKKKALRTEKTHDDVIVVKDRVCRFQSGKTYNCDLSASYNIGARYYIREILKSVSVTERLRIEAKVPQCSKRSTSTYATLISLCAELHASA